MSQTEDWVLVPYTGNAATSALIARLSREGRKVLAAGLDVGSEVPEAAERVERRARALGADDVVVRDVRPQVFDRFGARLIEASGVGAEQPRAWLASETYGLATAVVALAGERKVRAVAVCDEALGRELSRRAPAEVRVEQETVADPGAALEALGLGDEIPPEDEEGPYRVRSSLWGTVVEGGDLGQSWDELDEEVHPHVVPPWEAADLPEEFELSFADGLPKTLSGAEVDGVSLFAQLTRIGRRHGVGRGVSFRPDGARLAWESPAATIVLIAHDALEAARLDAPRRALKAQLAARYRELFEAGLQSEPLARDLEAFFRSTQRGVSGRVRVQLYRGRVEVMGVQ